MDVQWGTLSHRDMVALDRDAAEAARIANLIYVNDTMPGITRQRRGKGFVYYDQGRRINDDAVLGRLRQLAIPPAWTSVWICRLPNGHIQATGYDVRQRKQYRYHNQWSQLRKDTKFHKLYEFGKALPRLRVHLETDLATHGLTQRKVLAAVVSLMERTYIRIGNADYEKLYGSHGITTLKDDHVDIHGTAMRFSFRGKKGIEHEITLRHRRLARIVKQCRDIPGKELFQFYDDVGQRHPIDSGMVNSYIKETSGGDFSAKDFRTWAGSLQLMRSLKNIGEAVTDTMRRRNINQALDEVSSKLGNTRAVCRKYYVHPGLIELYESRNLTRYVKDLDDIEHPDHVSGLTPDEQVLMRALRALQKPT